MRLIGTISNEPDAARFADYLQTCDIACRVDPVGGQWEVWIREEQHLDRGRSELQEFLADPAAPRYADVARQAQSLRQEEAARVRQFHRNYVEVRQAWFHPSPRRAPLTMLLIAACGLVALLTNFGFKLNPVGGWLFISVAHHLPDQPPPGIVPEVRQGEVWRLVTPIFLHFGGMHLLGNMYWLYVLGSMLEMRGGPWRLALLIALWAAASNLAQLLYGGPMFGGMSGVVFALVGHIWMRSRFDPRSGLHIPRGDVLFFFIWMGLCMTGAIGPVANMAHGAGLAAGVVTGLAPVALRRR